MREMCVVLAAVCAADVGGNLRTIVTAICTDSRPWVSPPAITPFSMALCSPPSTPLRVFMVTRVSMCRALTAAARSACPRHLRDGRKDTFGWVNG